MTPPRWAAGSAKERAHLDCRGCPDRRHASHPDARDRAAADGGGRLGLAARPSAHRGGAARVGGRRRRGADAPARSGKRRVPRRRRAAAALRRERRRRLRQHRRGGRDPARRRGHQHAGRADRRDRRPRDGADPERDPAPRGGRAARAPRRTWSWDMFFLLGIGPAGQHAWHHRAGRDRPGDGPSRAGVRDGDRLQQPPPRAGRG